MSAWTCADVRASVAAAVPGEPAAVQGGRGDLLGFEDAADPSAAHRLKAEPAFGEEREAA